MACAYLVLAGLGVTIWSSHWSPWRSLAVLGSLVASAVLMVRVRRG